MLYSYGSFLSKITLSLLCIMVPVPYVSINPSKKREVQVVSDYNFLMSKKKKHHYIQEAFLKNFSLGEQIFVFDKAKNEIRKSNVYDVFEANNFYRIPIRSYWGSIGTEEKEKTNSDIIDRLGKPFDELSEDDKNKAEDWLIF